MSVLAEVTRGHVVESVHRGGVVVADAAGNAVAAVGESEVVAFLRSCAKPFQAVPLVRSGAADAFGFGTAELALSCASHDGTPQHVRVAERMLRRLGLDADALRCGMRAPFDPQANARATLGIEPATEVTCECSGEHAGMLAVCLHRGWPLETYPRPDHPLQAEVRETVALALGLAPEELAEATDGCTIPTFGGPIRTFARAYALLAAPDAAPAGLGAAMRRLRDAMLTHPVLIGGADALDTQIIQATEGRVLAKLGAEGLLCLAIPERGLGVVVRAEDGQERGLGPAAFAVLEGLGLERSLLDALRERCCPPVTNNVGAVVGETRPAFALRV